MWKSIAWVSADQTTHAHICRSGATKAVESGPPRAIEGRPLTSRVMRCGRLHLDFKEWTHPELWASKPDGRSQRGWGQRREPRAGKISSGVMPPEPQTNRDPSVWFQTGKAAGMQTQPMKAAIWAAPEKPWGQGYPNIPRRCYPHPTGPGRQSI